MTSRYRPTWIDCDLGYLEQNFLKVKSFFVSSRTQLMAVVKADAYGHGAASIARKLESVGVSFFGVSSIEEGICLRRAGVKGHILILGSALPFSSSFAAALKHRLDVTISSIEAASYLGKYLKRAGGKTKFRAHLKMETGMARIGARPETVAAMATQLAAVARVELSGIYTHFSSARDQDFTSNQLGIFHAGVAMLKARGVHACCLHSANSTAALNYPETQMDMVRCGLALYGGLSGFEPIASFKSRVVFLKRLDPGSPISYDRAFVTTRETMVATLPVGYGDGLPARASKRAQVLIGGKRRPILGLITMDMLMVDVSDAPAVRIGDMATLIGEDGGDRITANDWAAWSGTSVYEILCRMGGSRTPHLYYH